MYFDRRGIGGRLKKGLFASSFGFLVNLLAQIVTVPLLLYFWGGELYGEWLILMAIPAYISFSNIGISDAMSTEMTIMSGRRDYGQAQSVFENAWKSVTLVSISVALIVVVGIGLVPSVTNLVGISVVAEGEVITIISMLSIYILLGIQFSLIGGGYRCVGRYPEHAFIVNMSKLVELLASVVAVYLGSGPAELVLLYVVVRVVFLLTMVAGVKRHNKWITFSYGWIDLIPIRKILKPSLSSAGYGIGNIIVNQGVVLSIGHFLGGSSVAAYSVMRTLTRVLIKFAGMLNSNYMPEMSAAFGAKEMIVFRKLNRQLSRYTFWMVVVTVLLLSGIGEYILSIWTLDKVEFDRVVFIFVLLEAATFFIGYTGSVPIVATNNHSIYVVVYVVFSSMSLFVSWIMLPFVGLAAVPLVFSVGNFLVGVFAIMNVMKISDDKFFGYVAAVVFMKNEYAK